MSKMSRNLLMSVFMLAGIGATKVGHAQDAYPASPTASAITPKAVGNMSEIAPNQDLSKINDVDYLKKQDSLGLKLKSRTLGFLLKRDADGKVINKDSAMFYSFTKQMDEEVFVSKRKTKIVPVGVELNEVLAHTSGAPKDTFAKTDLFSRIAVIKSNPGTPNEKMEAAFVSNRKRDLIDADFFETCVTGEENKQAILRLSVDDMAKMDLAMQIAPLEAAGFAQAGVDGAKKNRNVPPAFVSYTGKDLGNGVFEIINFSNSSLNHTITSTAYNKQTP